ncbi:uncharacterized protein LOC142588122 [Dermacentor variabilis]|uniref:uncharacterized protein LOC142588122 n=1 Tax=Dermacentor variabilis TaxID=34621 RepID=UPI003F5AE550
MAVGRISEYRLGTNASWDEYVERLEMFCEANKIAKEQKSRPLSCCGEEAYGLITTLVKPARPTAATYEEIKTVVRKNLHPRLSELYARFLFYKRNQAAEESVTDYVTALRKLAEEQLPLGIMMRHRVVCGLQNEAVQQRLLAKHDLTFNVAYDMAATAEATAKQQQDICMQGRDETKHCQDMIQATCTKQDAMAEGSSCYRRTVFRRDLPGFNEPPVYIELKHDAQPVVLKSRPVPLAFKDDVGKEVDHLVQQGVRDDIAYSNWATPLVVSLQYRGGQKNANADALSRLPAPGGEDEPQPPEEVLLSEAVDCAPLQAADIAALIKDCLIHDKGMNS